MSKEKIENVDVEIVNLYAEIGKLNLSQRSNVEQINILQKHIEFSEKQISSLKMNLEEKIAEKVKLLPIENV